MDYKKEKADTGYTVSAFLLLLFRVISLELLV
jgi:hypothetical protein